MTISSRLCRPRWPCALRAFWGVCQCSSGFEVADQASDTKIGGAATAVNVLQLMAKTAKGTVPPATTDDPNPAEVRPPPSMPVSPYTTTSPAYGLIYNISLGSLGDLSGAHAGLAASLILGWGPSPNDTRETAAKQIAAITMHAYGVSQVWLNPPIEMRSLALEPEVIHYKFQMEFDKDIPGRLHMSSAGWTLDNAKQVAKPASWPTILFTPQTGDNDLPEWKVDGAQAAQEQMGEQTLWVVTQTVDAAVVPAYFNSDWDNLKLSERQLGRLQTWVRRNADLVDRRFTSAASIYETDAVSFASPGVPLIDRNNLAPVKPDADSTLYSVLESLLLPLNFGGVELAPYIRLLGEFRYDLVAPAEGDDNPLQASYPVILQPNLELNDLDMSPNIAAKSIAAELINRRAGFVGRGGNVYLDLSITLFGSEEGQQIPLINIAPLSLDVSNVPESWWMDT